MARRIHPTVAGDVRLNRGELLISARAWAAEWGYAELSFRGLLRRWAAGGLIEIDTRRVARRVGLVIVILHYYQHLRIVGVDRAAPAGSPLAGRGKPAKGKDEYPSRNQPTTDGWRDRSAEALRNGCETAASEPRSEGNITRINQCTNPSLRKKKEEEKKDFRRLRLLSAGALSSPIRSLICCRRSMHRQQRSGCGGTGRRS